MPWHDVAVRLTGPSVLDLSRHFIQYWNYVNFQLNMDDRQLLMYVGLTDHEIDATSQQHHNQDDILAPTNVVSVKSYRDAVRLTRGDDDKGVDFLAELELDKSDKKAIKSAVYSVEVEDN